MIDGDIKRLEELSKQMEQGDLPLEKALELFQEGVALVRSCTLALERAELRVKEILETQNGFEEKELP